MTSPVRKDSRGTAVLAGAAVPMYGRPHPRLLQQKQQCEHGQFEDRRSKHESGEVPHHVDPPLSLRDSEGATERWGSYSR